VRVLLYCLKFPCALQAKYIWLYFKCIATALTGVLYYKNSLRCV